MNIVKQILIYAFFIIYSILFGYYSSSDFGFELILIVSVTVFGVLLYNPTLSLSACIALFSSQISLPFLPGRLNLFYVMVILLTLVISIRNFKKSSSFLCNASIPQNLFLIAIMVVLVITICFRGMGFKFMGGTQEGGMLYVKLFITGLLILLMPHVHLSPKSAKYSLALMLVFSIIPAIGDYLVSVGIYTLYPYLRGSERLINIFQQSVTMEGVTRFFTVGESGYNLSVLPWVFVSVHYLFTYRAIIMIPYIIVTSFMMLFSGHRSCIINSVIFYASLLYYQKAYNWFRIFLAIFAISLLWLGLCSFQNYYPPSVVRAISFIPGINVHQESIIDAAGTSAWRIRLWKMSLKYIPQYFIIGQGYAYNADEYARAVYSLNQGDDYTWALVTAAYHNGHLSLLIGMGFFGLVAGYGFLFCVIKRHYEMTKLVWNSQDLKRLHSFSFAYTTVFIISFVTWYGDVPASFPNIFFWTAVMEMLIASDSKILTNNTTT